MLNQGFVCKADKKFFRLSRPATEINGDDYDRL